MLRNRNVSDLSCVTSKVLLPSALSHAADSVCCWQHWWCCCCSCNYTAELGQFCFCMKRQCTFTFHAKRRQCALHLAGVLLRRLSNTECSGCTHWAEHLPDTRCVIFQHYVIRLISSPSTLSIPCACLVKAGPPIAQGLKTHVELSPLVVDAKHGGSKSWRLGVLGNCLVIMVAGFAIGSSILGQDDILHLDGCYGADDFHLLVSNVVCIARHWLLHSNQRQDLQQQANHQG